MQAQREQLNSPELQSARLTGIQPSESLWQEFAQAQSSEVFFRSWLGLMCSFIPGVTHGALVLGQPDTGPFGPKAVWPPEAVLPAALTEVAERALSEQQRLVVSDGLETGGSAQAGHAVAFPVLFGGQLHGVAALALAHRPDSELQWALRQLHWGMSWLEVWHKREAREEAHDTQERLMSALDLLGTVLEQERFDAAARALVTEIAMRFNCDRASLGVVRRKHTRVIAVSHSAQFGKRMNLINAIGMAMDEAIDQKTVVNHPLPEDAEVLVTRDHERLAQAHGCGSILTVPFAGAGDLQGALLLERPVHLPFTPDIVETCQSVMAALARVLEVKRLNDRPLRTRIYDELAEQGKKLTGPRYVRRKLVVTLLLLVVVFFSFATAQYRVTAPSTLEGAVRRTIAAPFDGYISTAPLRAGDIVRAGTVLATLDDRDLKVERVKWTSQYAQYSRQYQEAIAAHDRARAQIARAQAEQARAQVALIDGQLSRSSVRAPFDGIVVKGDLSQSLGGAVKRGDALFEITPLDSYRLIVQVDESEITEVQAGQKGQLVLGSIANEHFGFTVSKVTPVTTSREGRNYFRVEGLLDQVSGRLRPGMEGVGKIEIEERKLIWIWTRKLVNWMRLFIWTWWP